MSAAPNNSASVLERTLIGHNRVKTELGGLISRGTVPHALLFSGPSGVGKRTAARAFAADLLARSPRSESVQDAESGEAWRLVKSGNHPDLHMVKKEPERKDLPVDSIRALCRNLQLKPYLGGYSVAIIDEADQMSLAAANALLMTLEEPSAASHLILVSDAPQRLPETILSRCQTVYFNELAGSEIKEILQRIFAPAIRDEAQLTELATIAHGSLAPLGVAAFIDSKTLELEDEKGAREHLARLSSETARLRGKLEQLLSSRGPNEALALSLAAEVGSDKENLPLVWQVLRSELREKLRRADSGSAAFYGQLLTDALEAEQRSKERTLNPQLQLSSLFLRLSAR